MRRTATTVLATSLLVLAGCMLFNPGPEILYEETFSGATADQWLEDDGDETSHTLENGQYHVRFKISDAWATSIRNTEQGPFGNFQLDIDVIHVSGENNLCGPGVLFRIADWDNLYGFRVSPAGTYSIWEEVDGTFTTLVGWTASDSVKVGAATNHLTVQADGSSLTFLINGQVVEQLVDASTSTGSVGVYARTYDGVTNAHEAFDNLVVTELK
jgi:hypothetical protein